MPCWSPRTEEVHAGQLYELTGPRLISFTDAVREISQATGREIVFEDIPVDAFSSGMAEQGVPQDAIDLMVYLLTPVLDGRNESVKDGV